MPPGWAGQISNPFVDGTDPKSSARARGTGPYMRTKRPVLGVGLIKWPLTCAQLDTPQAVGILTRHDHEQCLHDALWNRVNVPVSRTPFYNSGACHPRPRVRSMSDDSRRVRMPTTRHCWCPDVEVTGGPLQAIDTAQRRRPVRS